MTEDRKHLTSLEVGKLIEATASSRNAERDRCLILLMFRHGLRYGYRKPVRCNCHGWTVQAVCCMCKRLKKGLSTTHPLRPDELRVIRAWLAVRPARPEEKAFFISERGGALSRLTVWYMLRGLGEKAGLAVAAHPHMLRHACGYALADQDADTRLIQDYLGHRNIQHMVRYTATNAARFERLWK